MANRTVKDAKSIRGTNPQYLIEKIIRTRIYDSKYWKEECFALSAELVVDKAMSLRFVGGVFGGNMKATPFICLTLKMLQIQPEKDIIVEFIRNEEFKYVRALGAFYMRLVGTSLDCYKYLEPLLADSRKLRKQNRDGQFELIHMDEFIDELLTQERAYDVIMPRIQKRYVLEENNEIENKVSALDDDFEDAESVSNDEDYEEEEEILKEDKKHRRNKSVERERSPRRRSPYYDRKERREKDRERAREKLEKDKREKERKHRDYKYRERRDYRDRDRERERDRDRDHRVRDRGDRDRRRRDYNR